MLPLTLRTIFSKNSRILTQAQKSIQNFQLPSRLSIFQQRSKIYRDQKAQNFYDPYFLLAESSRHSPMSDHSSLFDSVSGTAINLGRNPGVVPVPLHGSHQRISSLARSDVRDLQPGLIKDSTLMRPAVAESSNRPLATEAHPNPSVIPELAEENVRGNPPEIGNQSPLTDYDTQRLTLACQQTSIEAGKPLFKAERMLDHIRNAIYTRLLLQPLEPLDRD